MTCDIAVLASTMAQYCKSQHVTPMWLLNLLEKAAKQSSLHPTISGKERTHQSPHRHPLKAQDGNSWNCFGH